MAGSAYPNANQIVRSLKDVDLPSWGLPPFLDSNE